MLIIQEGGEYSESWKYRGAVVGQGLAFSEHPYGVWTESNIDWLALRNWDACEERNGEIVLSRSEREWGCRPSPKSLSFQKSSYSSAQREAS
jgi:hypothetical protein